MCTRVYALMVVLACTAGCYSWRTIPSARGPAARTFPSGAVRVTLTDGRRLELLDGTVSNDTLRAWDSKRFNFNGGGRVAVSVPVSEIQRVERLQLNSGRTTAFVLFVGLPFALLVTAAVVVSSVCGSGPMC